MKETEVRPDARIREILARPIWNIHDICIVFNLPASTFEQILRERPIPGMFLVGRLRHVSQENAMAWIESMPKYTPRTNNRRVAA